MTLKFTLLLLAAGIAPALTGCASTPTALAPVGPDGIARAQPGPQGYLKVFTATQTVDADFQAYFHPHLGYDIEDASGRRVKFVPNHSSDLDEAPDEVSLPPGRYNVVAESAWCGLVTVPVVIQPGRATVVHLDGNAWQPSGAAANRLVYLPNGEAVGWSSRTAAAAP